MLTIELTPREIAELKTLEEGQAVEADYHGLSCFITYTGEIGDVEIDGRWYILGFYNPPEWKIKESKIVTVRLYVYFDDDAYDQKAFSCYKCNVRSCVRKMLKTNYPEYSSYRYVVIDEKGRIVK